MAEPGEVLGVEVPHARDVVGELAPRHTPSAIDLAGHDEGAWRADVELAASRPGVLGAVIADEPGQLRHRFEGRPQRQPAVGDLGRLAQAARQQRGDVDRHVCARRLEREPHAAPGAHLGALVVEGLAGEDRADDVHVVRGASHGPAERDAMQGLDHSCRAAAQPDNRAPARHLVERGEVLRERGGCAREHVDDAGRELDLLGARSDQHQRGERVARPCLLDPHGVHARAVGCLDPSEDRLASLGEVLLPGDVDR